MVTTNFCKSLVVRNLEKNFHKLALYFWNLSCRNINAQKTLDYTLTYEISFLPLSILIKIQ